jgi:HK97 family phage major capsid protein
MKFKSAKEARTAALEAHNKARAIKDKYGNLEFSEWESDDVQQFKGHMGDFTEAHQAYEEFNADAGLIETFNNATSIYTPNNSGQTIINPMQALAGGEMEQYARLRNPQGGFEQTDEQRTAARAQHRQAFHRFMAGGPGALSGAEQLAYMGAGNNFTHEQLAQFLPQEQFALVGTVDHLGGFLVPDDFMDELIVELAGFAVMRAMARVRTTTRQAATFMTVKGSGNDVYSSGLTGNFRSEGWVLGGQNPPTQNQPQFGRERVPVHIWAPDVVELTMELIDDAGINLDVEIRRLLAETKALDEDSAFINGTGVGMPMGILREVAAGNIATVNSGQANGQSYTGLVNLWSALPAQYRANGSFLLNSFTLGLWALLEDSAGNPIFPTNEIPNQLFGRPLAISEFMPDGNSDGNNAVIYGDFNFYGIADRMDLRIIRLVERFAPNIGMLAIARTGGQVLKTNPFRAQVVGA